MKKPIVSIIICTHKRSKLLAGAVLSLVKQTGSPDYFEVIIVDNDYQQNKEVKKIVSCATSKIEIKYLHEPKLGLSIARNSGGRIARAEYVGYMDDDAKANPKYIDNVNQIISICKPDIFGGPYFPFYNNDKPKWYKDKYGTGSYYGEKSRYLYDGEYLSGGNIIFKKSFLNQYGWFDPGFGMSENKVWYGEETILQIRGRNTKPDLKVFYDPKLYVLHLVGLKKQTIRWEFKSAFLRGYSQAYFWISDKDILMETRKAPINMIKILLEIFFDVIFMLILRDKNRYPLFQNFLIEVVARKIQSLGIYLRQLRKLIIN